MRSEVDRGLDFDFVNLDDIWYLVTNKILTSTRITTLCIPYNINIIINFFVVIFSMKTLFQLFIGQWYW